MALSLEMKALLGDFLILGGIGICGLVSMILFVILYFRLTRKYDVMFPEYDRIIPLPFLMGTVVRTGLYAHHIAFKNLSKHKRHSIMHEVTNHYDFRGNAPLFDITLSYLMVFSSLIFLASVFTFYILKKILGIDL